MPSEPLDEAFKFLATLFKYAQDDSGDVDSTYEGAIADALKKEGTPEEIRTLAPWIKKLNPYQKARLNKYWKEERFKRQNPIVQKAKKKKKPKPKPDQNEWVKGGPEDNSPRETKPSQSGASDHAEAMPTSVESAPKRRARHAVRVDNIVSGGGQTVFPPPANESWQSHVTRATDGKIKVQIIPPVGTAAAPSMTWEKDWSWFQKEWNPMMERWAADASPEVRPILGAVRAEVDKHVTYFDFWKKVDASELLKEKKEKLLKEKLRKARAAGRSAPDRVATKSLIPLNNALDSLKAAGIPYPTLQDVQEYLEANPEGTNLRTSMADIADGDPRTKDLSRLNELVNEDGDIPQSIRDRHAGKLADTQGPRSTHRFFAPESPSNADAVSPDASSSGGRPPPRPPRPPPPPPPEMPGDPADDLPLAASNDLGVEYGPAVRPRIDPDTDALARPEYKVLSTEEQARVKAIHSEIINKAADRGVEYDPDLHVFRSPTSHLTSEEILSYQREYRQLYGLDDLLTEFGGVPLTKGLDGGSRGFGKMPTDIASKIAGAEGVLPARSINPTEQFFATNWIQYRPDMDASDVERYLPNFSVRPERAEAVAKLLEQLQRSDQSEIGNVSNFDIETTGLDPKGERIISATIRTTNAEGIEGATSWYFDAPRMRAGLIEDIDPLTGRTETVDMLTARHRELERLTGKPVVITKFGTGVEQMMKQLLQADLVMGQNIGFDYSFLVTGAKQHPRYKTDPEFRILVGEFAERFRSRGETIWDTREVAMTLWGDMPLNKQLRSRGMFRPFSMNNVLMETDFLDWVIETLDPDPKESIKIFEETMRTLGGLHDDRFDTWVGNLFGQFQRNFLRGTGRNLNFVDAETRTDPWRTGLHDRILKAEAYTPYTHIVDMEKVPEGMRGFVDALGPERFKDNIARVSPLELGIIQARIQARQQSVEFNPPAAEEVVERFMPLRGRSSNDMKGWTTKAGRITRTRRISDVLNPSVERVAMNQQLRDAGAPFQGMHWLEKHLSSVFSKGTVSSADVDNPIRKSVMSTFEEILHPVVWESPERIYTTAKGSSMMPFEVLKRAAEAEVFGDRIEHPDFMKLDVSPFSYDPLDAAGEIKGDRVFDVGLGFRFAQGDQGQEELDRLSTFLHDPDNLGMLDEYGMNPEDIGEYMANLRGNADSPTRPILRVASTGGGPDSTRMYDALTDAMGGSKADYSDTALGFSTFASKDMSTGRNVTSMGIFADLFDAQAKEALYRQLEQGKSLQLALEALMRTKPSLMAQAGQIPFEADYPSEAVDYPGVDDFRRADELGMMDEDLWWNNFRNTSESEARRVSMMDQRGIRIVDAPVNKVKTAWRKAAAHPKLSLAGAAGIGLGYYKLRKKKKEAPYEPTTEAQPFEKEDWYARYQQESALMSGGLPQRRQPDTRGVMQALDQNKTRSTKMGPSKYNHLFGGEYT